MASAVTTSVIVRPRRSLVSTAVISIALGMVPVFGVLYWLGVQNHNWHIVFVVHLVLIVASFAMMFRQLSVFSAVSGSELFGRGIFSPMERVSIHEIADVTIVPTYVGQSPEPVKQLLVRDASGRRLFRMRGNFWHDGDLLAIANALPVTPEIVKNPITIRDFYRCYPGSAYWFENRPVILLAISAGAVVAALGVTALLLAVFR